MAAPPPPPGSPPHDPGAGGSAIHVDIDPDIADLVPPFLASRRNDVRDLRLSLDTASFEAIRRIGHNLRGCGGAYGFQMISDIGEAIGGAANAKDPARVREQIERLADYLARVTY